MFFFTICLAYRLNYVKTFKCDEEKQLLVQLCHQFKTEQLDICYNKRFVLISLLHHTYSAVLSLDFSF